jgi:hypothetical protein
MQLTHKYTGAYARKYGQKVLLRDARLPPGFSEYSVPCGKKGTKKVYVVCNEILAGNIHCNFSLRKDVFFRKSGKIR